MRRRRYGVHPKAKENEDNGMRENIAIKLAHGRYHLGTIWKVVDAEVTINVDGQNVAVNDAMLWIDDR